MVMYSDLTRPCTCRGHLQNLEAPNRGGTLPPIQDEPSRLVQEAVEEAQWCNRVNPLRSHCPCDIALVMLGHALSYIGHTVTSMSCL